MDKTYGAKKLDKRAYGLPKSTECLPAPPQKGKVSNLKKGQKPKEGPVIVEVASNRLMPDAPILEVVNDQLVVNVKLKAGARLTFAYDERNLQELLVPKVNEPFNFYVEPTGHLSAAHEICRPGVAAKAITHSTTCPRLLCIVDRELFHHHPSLDLSKMRATTVKAKEQFITLWHESAETQEVFFVRCNKFSIDFIRETVMEDPRRDDKPGVFLLVEKDTRLYSYPPIKMCTEFHRTLVGKDKTHIYEAFFQTFMVEALQEIYPGQKDNIVKYFPFQDWSRVAEFVIFSVFGRALSAAGDLFPPVLSENDAMLLRDEARVIPWLITRCDSRDALALRNYSRDSRNIFKLHRVRHLAYLKFLGRLGVVKKIRTISVHKTRPKTKHVHGVAQVTLPTVFLNLLQALTPGYVMSTQGKEFHQENLSMTEVQERLGMFMEVARVNWTELKFPFAVVKKKQLKFRQVEVPKLTRTKNSVPEKHPCDEVFALSNAPEELFPYGLAEKQLPHGEFPKTQRLAIADQISSVLEWHQHALLSPLELQSAEAEYLMNFKGPNGESMAQLILEYIIANTLPQEPLYSDDGDFRLHLLVDDDERKDYWLRQLNEKLPKIMKKLLLTKEERERTNKRSIIEELTPALPEESEIDDAFHVLQKVNQNWGPHDLKKMEQAAKNLNTYYLAMKRLAEQQHGIQKLFKSQFDYYGKKTLDAIARGESGGPPTDKKRRLDDDFEEVSLGVGYYDEDDLL